MHFTPCNHQLLSHTLGQMLSDQHVGCELQIVPLCSAIQFQVWSLTRHEGAGAFLNSCHLMDTLIVLAFNRLNFFLNPQLPTQVQITSDEFKMTGCDVSLRQ